MKNLNLRKIILVFAAFGVCLGVILFVFWYGNNKDAHERDFGNEGGLSNSNANISSIDEMEDNEGTIRKAELEEIGNFYYTDEQGNVYYEDPGYYGFEPVILDGVVADSFLAVGGVYAIGDGKVFSKGEKIEADANSFVLLQERPSYGKDKNSVFYFEKKIEGADPNSYEFLDGGYAKDNTSIYIHDTRIVDADVKSFAVMGTEGFAKDKNGVYWGSKKLEAFDASSFGIIDGRYIKSNNEVYIAWYPDWITKIEGADPDTFSVLKICEFVEKSSGAFSKDKNAVYAGYKRLDHIDVDTFEFLGSFDTTSGFPSGSSYSKDKNYVYEGCGTIIENADPATFIFFEDTAYGKDKNSVYYWGGLLEEADVETFESLRFNYGKDSSHVFFGADSIGEVDISSFVTVAENVAKDANHLYVGQDIAEFVDTETVVHLGSGFLKDRFGIYYVAYGAGEADEFGIKKIEDVDLSTFEVVISCYAKDKNKVYCGSQVLDVVTPEECTTDNPAGCREE